MILGRRVPTLNVSATGDQHHAAQGCGVSTGRSTQGGVRCSPGCPRLFYCSHGGRTRLTGSSSPAYRTGKVGKPVPDTAFLVGGGAVLAVLFALVALWVRR